MTRRPLGTRGSLATDWSLLLALVGLVAWPAFAGLGGGFGEAIRGDAGGVAMAAAEGAGRSADGAPPSHRSTVSRQAGGWRHLFQGLQRAVEGLGDVVEGTEFRTLRRKEAIEQGILQEVALSERSIRVGYPDHLHEAPQGLRYADVEGGGLYTFPEADSVQGIDGYFYPWRHERLLAARFVDAQARGWKPELAPHGVAVSLKDYSGESGTLGELTERTLSRLLYNGERVLTTDAVPPADLPAIVGTDAFVSLRQLTQAQVVEGLDAHDWIRVKNKKGRVTHAAQTQDLVAPSGRWPTPPFRQVVFDTADGVLRLTMQHEDGWMYPVVRGSGDGTGVFIPRWSKRVRVH